MKLFTCAGCILLLAAPVAQADEQDSLQDRCGVTVVTTDLASRIVPVVAQPDRPVTMQDLSEADRTSCFAAVDRALSVYPPALVRSLVQTVALAGMIHAWDIRIGGFHAPGLLAVNCETAGVNASYEMNSIHNSLAALVLTRAAPDWAAWQALDPPGFRYGDEASYKAELQDSGASDSDAALHRSGFATALGLTGRENDFEAYAERAFAHSTDLATVAAANPRMQGKLRLLMRSYLSLGPEIKAEFNRNGLAAAAAQ